MFIAILVAIVIIIIYLFAVRPSTDKTEKTIIFSDWLYAHRGLHDNNIKVPENSLAAFSLAVQSGYGMELDVQLTSDGEVVVFHDENLKRMCNLDKKIGEMTKEEIKGLRLLGTEEGIPTLREVLKLVNAAVPLIVEIKPYNKIDKVCEAVEAVLADYKGLYCVESFSPYIVRWYKKNKPDTVRGQLACSFSMGIKFLPLEILLTNVLTRPDFIAYKHSEGKNLSLQVCRNLFGCQAVAWTISSQNDLVIAEKYFDVFIFENFCPDVNIPDVDIK